MKKLLLSFLFIANCSLANAQEAKPTKEQTVEYIINTLKNYERNNEDERAGVFVFVKYSIKEITFSADKLYVKMYDYLSITDGKTNEYLEEVYIDLKDIEQIKQRKNRYGDCLIDLISVNSKKTIKSIRNNIRPTTNTDNQNVSTITIGVPCDEKLVQAFNHLRKFCGAPEPIKF